ncbi:MAG: hypothetical protein IMY72_11405 [Bacteroidetes bacterium]|nr:hypothetical protein [Bacteroidota bacterium]
MKNSKLARFVLFFFIVFLLSIIFTLIDGDISCPSKFGLERGYVFGQAVGQTMRHFIKIIGMLSLILITYRLFKNDFKKNN